MDIQYIGNVYVFVVQKVNEITRDNISKLVDRGDNLNDLQARTGKQQQWYYYDCYYYYYYYYYVVVVVVFVVVVESLSDHAVNFNFTARRLKRKVCWKNVKLWFVLLFILMVILAVLISE